MLPEVHLYLAPTNITSSTFQRILSPDEQTRADRFYFPQDRARYIAAHAHLRAILAQYLGCDARAVAFATGRHGKPHLAHSHTQLRFNLSHSGDFMLLAISTAREVGVDLELMRPDAPFDLLAEQCFTAEEVAHLRTFAASEKPPRFYDLWTRTEARLKASGLGLGHGLQRDDRENFDVHSFTPAPGYAAALAVEGRQPFQLRCFSWPR